MGLYLSVFTVLEIKTQEKVLKSTLSHLKITMKNQIHVNINVFYEKYILENKKLVIKVTLFYILINLWCLSGRELDFLFAQVFNLLQYVVLVEVYEQSSASQR